MSSSKKTSKLQFSRRFKFTILIMVILTVFAIILILANKWQNEIARKSDSPSVDIEKPTSVSYDKDQILVDTTDESLEIIELPSLEAK